MSEGSVRVSWDHSADDVVLYKLSWAPFIGGDTKEVSVLNKGTRREEMLFLTLLNLNLA